MWRRPGKRVNYFITSSSEEEMEDECGGDIEERNRERGNEPKCVVWQMGKTNGAWHIRDIYVCMYTHTHTHTHTHTYIHIYTYIYIYILIHVYIYAYTYIYSYMCIICIHTYIYMCEKMGREREK